MHTEGESTRVIFRKFPNGDVIAIFPDIAEGHGHVSSYMQVGQHGPADLVLVGFLSPCDEATYSPLRRELESTPYEYRLDIVESI